MERRLADTASRHFRLSALSINRHGVNSIPTCFANVIASRFDVPRLHPLAIGIPLSIDLCLRNLMRRMMRTGHLPLDDGATPLEHLRHGHLLQASNRAQIQAEGGSNIGNKKGGWLQL
ncbi:MAG: hypothetical protein IPM60_08445 [Rhodospirillales bacterium]|nr:hypothetical protein [Rhodospirillales bacterium]